MGGWRLAAVEGERLKVRSSGGESLGWRRLRLAITVSCVREIQAFLARLFFIKLLILAAPGVLSF